MAHRRAQENFQENPGEPRRTSRVDQENLQETFQEALLHACCLEQSPPGAATCTSHMTGAPHQPLLGAAPGLSWVRAKVWVKQTVSVRIEMIGQALGVRTCVCIASVLWHPHHSPHTVMDLTIASLRFEV